MTVDSVTEQPGIFRQVISVGAHTLHADVAEALGGQGSAPGAHEYFDLSLAACKTLTAHIYARRHNIGLERIEAHIERDSTREREGIYVLRVRLAYFGPLSDEEKQQIHDVLVRCPVHKLMTTATITIDTAPLGVP